MFTKILLTIILSISIQCTVEEHHVAEAHEMFSNMFEHVVKSSLAQADSRFAEFPYLIRQMELNSSWTHGNVPTNSFKFNIYSDEAHLCSFDFQVDGFNDHIGEVLADRSQNKEFYS